MWSSNCADLLAKLDTRPLNHTRIRCRLDDINIDIITSVCDVWRLLVRGRRMKCRVFNINSMTCGQVSWNMNMLAFLTLSKVGVTNWQTKSIKSLKALNLSGRFGRHHWCKCYCTLLSGGPTWNYYNNSLLKMIQDVTGFLSFNKLIISCLIICLHLLWHNDQVNQTNHCQHFLVWESSE